MILDGAEQVLENEDAVAFNTNRVAEIAGISVGSLYQYFANKEMLITAVVERGILESEAMMRSVAATHPNEGPEELLKRLFRELITDMKPYRRLLARVFSLTPLASESGLIPMLESRITDLFRSWLATRSEHYHVARGSAGLILVSSSAIYLFIRWMTDLHHYIDEESFINVCTELMVSALGPGGH